MSAVRLLRNAADYGKNFPFSRVLFELLEPVKHLLFGFVANAAGVVDHEFRLIRRFHLRVALLNQRAHDFLGIVRIHLAAESFYIEGLHCLTADTVVYPWRKCIAQPMPKSATRK